MEYAKGDVATMLEKALQDAGLDPRYARAILAAENTGSGKFNPSQKISVATTSPKGALGLTQIMPATWNGLVAQGYLSDKANPQTLEGQIAGTVAVLKEKTKYAGNDPELMAVAYNSTPARVAAYKASRDPKVLLPETQKYKEKFMANFDPTQGTHPAGTFDNVLSTVQQVQNQGQMLLGKIQGVTSSFVDDAGDAAKTLTAKGDAESRLELTRANRVIDQQAYMRNIMSAAGIDSEAAAGSFQAKAREIAQAHNEIRALQPEIQKLRGVSFLDDPLGWVQAQFKLEATTGRYNAAAKVFNDNTAAVGALQQMAGKQAALQPGVNPNSILAEAKLVAETKKLQADFDLLRVSQQTRQAQLSAYATELQLGQQQVRTAFDLAQITADQAKRAEMALAKTKSQKDLVAVNAYQERRGAGQFADIQSFDSLPPAERAKILKYALVPQMALGGTPGESLNQLIAGKGYNVVRAEMPQAGQKFMDTFVERARVAAQTLKAANPRASEEEIFELAAEGVYENWKKELKLRDYSRLDSANPLAMNAAVYAQATGLKDNLMAEFVRAQPNGGAGLTPKDILSYAISQVQVGKPAAQISDEVRKFFEVGMKSQWEAYRLDRLGIPLTNPETGKFEFPVSGNVFGVWDRISDPRKSNANVKTFDLLNPAELQQFLILNTVATKYSNSPTGVSDVLKNIRSNTQRGPGGIAQ